MMDGLYELIEDIQTTLDSSPVQTLRLENFFRKSVQAILWTIVTGQRLELNDEVRLQQFLVGGKIDPVRGALPIPAFLLRHISAVRSFFGIKQEVLDPVRNLIQV